MNSYMRLCNGTFQVDFHVVAVYPSLFTVLDLFSNQLCVYKKLITKISLVFF